MPSKGFVKATLKESQICGTWETDFNTGGSFNLFNRFFCLNDNKGLDGESLNIKDCDWDEFKQEINDISILSNRCMIYRGQFQRTIGLGPGIVLDY